MNALRAQLKKYEAHIPAAALVAGFLWDTFTLGSPDSVFANIVLGGWFAIATASILLLNFKQRRGAVAPIIFLFLTQFSFGNLAGSLLVLYGKSGTFQGGALFFLLLGGFFIGNEFLRSRYTRVHFHVAVWYLLLLTYLALLVPIITGEIGERIFLLATAISLFAVAGFIVLLFVTTAEHFSRSGIIKIFLSVALIATTYNALYFFNLIPPVPLSLKNAGVYHSVSKLTSGDYRVTYETPPRYAFWRGTNYIFHLAPEESAYCFTSVYAPSGLSTSVYHRWQFYDEANKKWQTEVYVSFPIYGGRSTGYRGYSVKNELEEGMWRCRVETEGGTLVGVTTFEVMKVPTLVHLEQKVI